MYRMRQWSTRHARGLDRAYRLLEKTLARLQPLFGFIDEEKIDPVFSRIEHWVKGFLFDSQSCGQCTLGETGMACPMNCPKTLRNGPCGGVRSDGGCEIIPDMQCVWVNAWEGSKQLPEGTQAIQIIQSPLDNSIDGTSSWLRALRKKLNGSGPHAL